jgi:hypothetical protein
MPSAQDGACRQSTEEANGEDPACASLGSARDKEPRRRGNDGDREQHSEQMHRS